MKTIVLDRDGVINEDSDAFIKSADEFIPLPGSLEAIALLHQSGYRVIVATNQSGLARGLFTEYELAHIHEKLVDLVENSGGLIDSIFYCPHGPDDECDCRKPKPGLITRAEAELDLSLAGSFLIGDSLRDLQAAQSAGMRPVLVRTGKGCSTEYLLDESGFSGIPVYDNLLDAVQHMGL